MVSESIDKVGMQLLKPGKRKDARKKKREGDDVCF